jgi:hypothetical protein
VVLVVSTGWRDLKLAVRMDRDGTASAADPGSFIQKRTLTRHHVQEPYANVYAMRVRSKLPSIPFQRGSGADGIFHLYEA